MSPQQSSRPHHLSSGEPPPSASLPKIIKPNIEKGGRRRNRETHQPTIIEERAGNAGESRSVSRKPYVGTGKGIKASGRPASGLPLNSENRPCRRNLWRRCSRNRQSWGSSISAPVAAQPLSRFARDVGWPCVAAGGAPESGSIDARGSAAIIRGALSAALSWRLFASLEIWHLIA